MIEISNIRKEKDNEWTKLIVDVDWGVDWLNKVDRTLWTAVKNDNEKMLTSESYDAFILIPLYLAMLTKQNIKINGTLSKKLYRNIMQYVQQIFCDFSDELDKVDITIEGYSNFKKNDSIIGTGLSCGIDSLTTIYDHFEIEKDEDYKINTLFMFNHGSHGDYGDESRKLFEDRYRLNKKMADELCLPFIQLDSNFHKFTHLIESQKMGYLALYSCVFSIQKSIDKYYVSSCISYEEIKKFTKTYHDLDLAEFCESYLIPLLQPDGLYLINDGNQYKRSDKTKKILKWDKTKKYLNICINSENGHNCSQCSKCMRTLLVLDALNELENFKEVFDLNIYRKYSFYFKCIISCNYDKDAYYNDIKEVFILNQKYLPPKAIAYIYILLIKIFVKTKKILGGKKDV